MALGGIEIVFTRQRRTFVSFEKKKNVEGKKDIQGRLGQCGIR